MLSKVKEFYPTDAAHWRTWLEDNHNHMSSIWLVYDKKKTGKANLSWSEAVDEALCFGWIDGRKQTLDEKQFRQLFSVRKAGSTWSKINKDKVSLLAKEGKMRPAGLTVIERAKKDGSWTMLDSVEDLSFPPGLEKAFDLSPGSKEFFRSQSPSQQKMLLQWIVLAKRDETKNKRINKIVSDASQGIKTRF